MLVPAIQSKHSLMGFPTSFSIAINIRHRTIPLIPPPSKDKSCKDIESNQTTNITSILHTILKYKSISFSDQKSVCIRLVRVHTCSDNHSEISN